MIIVRNSNEISLNIGNLRSQNLFQMMIIFSTLKKNIFEDYEGTNQDTTSSFFLSLSLSLSRSFHLFYMSCGHKFEIIKRTATCQYTNLDLIQMCDTVFNHYVHHHTIIVMIDIRLRMALVQRTHTQIRKKTVVYTLIYIYTIGVIRLRKNEYTEKVLIFQQCSPHTHT